MKIMEVGTIQYSYITEIINNDTYTTLYTFSRTELEVRRRSIPIDVTGGSIYKYLRPHRRTLNKRKN
jgi:hypothetical protein